jgi:hypothetical protein
MNQQIKEKWVAALRSGDYMQGTHQLRTTDDRYCCLGVLCDINAKETGQGWDIEADKAPMYGGSAVAATEIIRDWAGMSSKQHSDCVTMNDITGYTFNQIADHVEEMF